MKKILICLVALVLCLGVCACGATTEETKTEPVDTEVELETNDENAWLYGSWFHDEYEGRGDSLDGTDLPKVFEFEAEQVKITRNGSEDTVEGTFTVDGDEVICVIGEETYKLQRGEEMMICSENPEGLYLIYFFGGYVADEDGGSTITAQEAESVARAYLSGLSGRNALLEKARVESMEFFEITSVSISGTGNYRVTLKGNFFGHDEYGALKDHYTFACTVPVNGRDGRVLTQSVQIQVGTA